MKKTTMLQRITECIGERFTKADLARECGISRAGVSKWFAKDDVEIEARHIFKLARLFQVDPEWLATGEGRKDRGAAQVRADAKEIPQARLDLIRKYGALPDEVRNPIRSLIEVTSAMVSQNYVEWERRIEAFNRKRDSEKIQGK